MARNKIIPYHPALKQYARYLRKNSTKTEVLLWKKIKGRALGVQFHRQVPILSYIVDFYCHEIGLAIEIDGKIHDHSFLYDAKRQGNLEKQGVNFLRFSNQNILQEMNMVLEQIKRQIKELSS